MRNMLLDKIIRAIKQMNVIKNKRNKKKRKIREICHRPKYLKYLFHVNHTYISTTITSKYTMVMTKT